jgi:tRNA U34 5-methylaminomethyl-2-thiouridine-forming methyltransferase MnmC
MIQSGQRKLIVTEDGSHTVAVQDLNVTFHSRHGAIQESKHVFIEAGFNYGKEVFPDQPLSILEVGFGTGLNAFLTAIEAGNYAQPVRYVAIDAYPLEMVTTATLNYPDRLGHEELFSTIQIASWNSPVPIHETFSLYKLAIDLLDYSCREKFHLLYFDAFAPEAQPQLWKEDIFRRLGECMHSGGAMVTYCSKGTVRRALEAAGWQVEKLPGPKGKREMVRAIIGNPQ